MFADEFINRLKVIACIEKPNMMHSEEFEPQIDKSSWERIKELLKSKDGDAQIIIWGDEADIPTAIETIEERCRMAMVGVPEETRKSFEDGTTIFERVLPGADRMYPDTDSAPIPLDDNYITELSKRLPQDVIDNYKQLKKWNIPEEVFTYIFSKNLFPVISKIVSELDILPSYAGTFFGHEVKFAEGHYSGPEPFNYNRVYKLFKFLKKKGIRYELAENMLKEMIEHPKMDFESILTSINFKKYSKNEIVSKLPLLFEKFKENHNGDASERKLKNWVMGQLRKIAFGNVNLTELSKDI